MEWKDMVDLQRELVKMGAKLSIVQRENARLKEELAKARREYELLEEYYDMTLSGLAGALIADEEEKEE